MFINCQQISIQINTTINCNLIFKTYIIFEQRKTYIIFEQRKNANETFALFLCHW
jgi:hypothetical protein